MDMAGKTVHQRDMADGGIIGLHVGSQHEAVVQQMVADLSDRILSATVALEVDAAARDLAAYESL